MAYMFATHVGLTADFESRLHNNNNATPGFLSIGGKLRELNQYHSNPEDALIRCKIFLEDRFRDDHSVANDGGPLDIDRFISTHC